VVIAAHGATSSRRGPYITGAARAWSRTGLAVVAADAVGHGDRAAGGGPTREEAYGPGVAEQMIADTNLLVDEVAARFPGLPIGYLGFSMGGLYGVSFAAAEPRIDAVVLAVAGAIDGLESFTEPGAAGFDPLPRAAGIAPRPVLMVNADADEVFDREAALALYDALAAPKEISFFPGSHAVWRSPAQWYRRMRTFLQETLGA
jgi:alpha-beta hydrolase superfamily lysophospholipase